MSATRASMASLSSGPLVSSWTFAPLPAASIMTPMMLFAFTLRPLRSRKTSQAYFAASCVSFAEARAWSPSLLTISTSRRCITGIDLEVQHAFAAARDGLLDHRVHALRAVGERADEHRQVDARHRLDVPRLDQLAHQVARRGAVDVGEDQH